MQYVPFADTLPVLDHPLSYMSGLLLWPQDMRTVIREGNYAVLPQEIWGSGIPEVNAINLGIGVV